MRRISRPHEYVRDVPSDSEVLIMDHHKTCRMLVRAITEETRPAYQLSTSVG